MMDYKILWEHVLRHYDNPKEFSEILIIARLPLLMLAGTSINKRKFAEYNRMHTKVRPNLDLKTIRSAFAIRSFGPKSIAEFNPDAIFEAWMGLITPDDAKGDIKCPRRRSLAAMI